MQVIDLPVEAITTPGWNPNGMDLEMRNRLRRSIQAFGVVVPLVVRPVANGRYETVGGAQRLGVLQELGMATIPCLVLEVDGPQARLLSQALNRIQGEDDLGLRAELLREVLKALPAEQVMSILPETTQSLEAMASLGQETMAQYLQNWQQAQAARLHHLQFQLQLGQLEVIEEALARVMPQARESLGNSPNARGTALYLLCQKFLAEED